jgi:hypothetical protein
MYASRILREDRLSLERTHRLPVAGIEHFWTMETNLDNTVGNFENIMPLWADVKV